MKSELFINTRNGKIIGFGAKDGDLIDSGKYQLIGISVESDTTWYNNWKHEIKPCNVRSNEIT